jgi:hypothetical protein
MKINTDNILYEVKYKNISYYLLELKRIDWIKGVCYLTFQQVDTANWFTFESNKISEYHLVEENLVS